MEEGEGTTLVQCRVASLTLYGTRPEGCGVGGAGRLCRGGRQSVRRFRSGQGLQHCPAVGHVDQTRTGLPDCGRDCWVFCSLGLEFVVYCRTSIVPHSSRPSAPSTSESPPRSVVRVLSGRVVGWGFGPVRVRRECTCFTSSLEPCNLLHPTGSSLHQNY